ncbi:sugar-binding domain-containing protein [Deinococcus sp. S9]|uniref:sugar-binding domain-containing protein n=1 Tax=Deinococcus sp. S9 TaxID=2545754 RepID=UPI001980798E|nr:sugar-binding domain-containing protein [Deinococcus sp. S9]
MGLKSFESPVTDTEMEDEELLSRAAWHYYHDGLTQADIGERLNLPRLKISRMLEKARRLGLIQVQINSIYGSCLALERALSERFGLHATMVIPALAGVNLNDRLGQAAAQYLMQTLQTGDMLAIGWGDTVTRALQRLAYTVASRNISIISLTGGVTGYLQGLGLPQIAAPNIHLIPAPIVASSVTLAQALREEPQIAELFAMTRLAHAALVGIGATNAQATLVQSGYVSPAELTLFQRMGAVGDILGQFFDSHGVPLDIPLHGQLIGVSLEQLRGIPIRIGASGGSQKVSAMVGALRGGHINVLVTDEDTATALLREGA